MKSQTGNPKRWIWWVIGHGLGSSTVAVLFSFAAFDLARFQLVWSSLGHGFELDWVALALHIGLSACAWALFVIATMWMIQRRREKKTKVVRRGLLSEPLGK